MDRPVADVPWPPKIVLTPSGWEASVSWNSSLVIIRKDGKFGYNKNIDFNV